MAIDTLAKLKSRVGFLANRDDLFASVDLEPAEIDSGITVAIENATLTISRDLAKRGGNGLQETVDDTLVTVSGTETVTFPTGYAGVRAFVRTSNPQVVLQGRDYSAMINEFPSPTPGQPLVYAVVSGTTPKAYLRPIPDSAYTLRLIYWKNLVDLTDSVTNPIFDNHPDIYEAAAMVEVALLVDDDAAAAKWRTVYDTKMNELTAQDRNAGWAAAMSGAAPQVNIAIA